MRTYILTETIHKMDSSFFLTQAMESKLLVGGKNIVDHTNEQQKILEQKRQEIAEQVTFPLLFWGECDGVRCANATKQTCLVSDSSEGVGTSCGSPSPVGDLSGAALPCILV